MLTVYHDPRKRSYSCFPLPNIPLTSMEKLMVYTASNGLLRCTNLGKGIDVVVMKMGNIAPTAGIEPTSLAIQVIVLTIIIY